jgi:hypothetical protein
MRMFQQIEVVVLVVVLILLLFFFHVSSVISERLSLFRSVLFCSVLFCSVLFCSVLFCSVLFCSVLFCSVLFCSVLPFLLKSIFALWCVKRTRRFVDLQRYPFSSFRNQSHFCIYVCL